MSLRKSSRQPKKKLDSSIWDLGEEADHTPPKRSRARQSSPPPAPPSKTKKSKVKVAPPPPFAPSFIPEDPVIIEARKKATALTDAAMERQISISTGKRFNPKRAVLGMDKNDLEEAQKKDLLPEKGIAPEITTDLIGSGEQEEGLTLGELIRRKKCLNYERLPRRHAGNAALPSERGEMKKRPEENEHDYSVRRPPPITDLIPSSSAWDEDAFDGDYIYDPSSMSPAKDATVKPEEIIDEKPPGSIESGSGSPSDGTIIVPCYVPANDSTAKEEVITDEKPPGCIDHPDSPSGTIIVPCYVPAGVKAVVPANEATVKSEENTDEKPSGRIESRPNSPSNGTVIVPCYVPADVKDDCKKEPATDQAVKEEPLEDVEIKEEGWEDEVKEEEYEEEDGPTEGEEQHSPHLFHDGVMKDGEEEYEEDVDDEMEEVEDEDGETYGEGYSDEYDDGQSLEKTEEDKLLDKRWREMRIKIYAALGEEPPKGRPLKNEMATLKKRLLENNQKATRASTSRRGK